jgi:hypothetical protein
MQSRIFNIHCCADINSGSFIIFNGHIFLMQKNLLFLTIIAIACNQSLKKPFDKVTIDTTQVNDNNKATEQLIHLKDTTFAEGDAVIFLRPDSARFDAYEKTGTEGIFEADSDFGFAISKVIDTISKHKNVKIIVSTSRYIYLKDCTSCPLTLDRDTIDYGAILSGKNKEIKLDTNIFGGEYYIDLIKTYFNKQ